MVGGDESRVIGLEQLEHVFERGWGAHGFLDTEAQSVSLVIVVVRI